MYRLVSKADGSFQILDEDGENYGVFGDQKEALKAMDELSTNKKFPNVVIHHKEGMSEKTPPEPFKPKYPEMPPVAKVIKKALTPPTKKSPVIKKSPIKAKRGRPKKAR